jgi:preprotein translocase subunit SecG
MWWVRILLGLYVLNCLILIVAVLLQPGKADAAALFGGGGSQTAFGPRGTQHFLGWVTIVTAAIFMGLGLLFSLPNIFGPSSVVQRVKEPPPIEQPAQPSNPPAPQPSEQKK